MEEDIWEAKKCEVRDKDTEREGGDSGKVRDGDSTGEGTSQEGKEQEQRDNMSAALVTVHVIQKTQLQSIYRVQPFKCVISSFSTPRAVCQNMTACHIQAATHAEILTQA